jgi:formylglycine-generating enzyme required for sulfatase activity
MFRFLPWWTLLLLVAAPARAADSVLYVVAVGIDGFAGEGAGVEDLQFAEADAHAVVDALTVGARATPGRTVEATVLAGSSATSSAVKAAVDRAAMKAGPDDTLVLFVATHGFSGDDGTDTWLATADTTFDQDLRASSLKASDLLAMVSPQSLENPGGTKAGQRLVIVDASHDGTANLVAGARGPEARSAGRPTANDALFAVASASQAYGLLTATGADQSGLESAEYCGGHGAFTCSLLRALGASPDPTLNLREAVDLDNDGTLSLSEVVDFASVDTAKHTGNQQIPALAGVDARLVLGRVPLLPTMVALPGGWFMMGCTRGQWFDCESDERAARKTYVAPFSIADAETSHAQFVDVMGAWNDPGPGCSEGGNCPQDRVSWCDAVVFLNKLSAREGLRPAYTGVPDDPSTTGCEAWADDVVWDRTSDGYRLPTEAEWEYAARAGTDLKYSGSDLPDDDGYAKASDGNTHPCHVRTSNAFGLYDMSNSLWEWTYDTYTGSYDRYDRVNPGVNPTNVGSIRVLRGGCFWHEARRSRVSLRHRFDPSWPYGDMGFRVARGVPVPPPDGGPGAQHRTAAGLTTFQRAMGNGDSCPTTVAE